jgi:NitT/TauT family transport system substrate-binding protein
MRALRWGVLAVVLAMVLAALDVSGLRSASAQDTTVKIGIARSTSNAAELMALNRGYFKDAGIKLQWDDIDTTANVIALLAQNQYNIVAGGISAGIFNALEKNLPITMLADRVSTPIGHNLMLRPDLKDTVKSLKDLKGKVIASNGQGSVSTYEIGKMLERDGLTIADVDLKIMPFTQMGLAFKNKAIDAALVIPPFVWGLEEQGLAIPFGNVDELVEPRPMTIAVIMANTDWVKANPDLVQRYVTALLRGARDYCNAYHGGSDRQEVIDALVNSKTEPRRELLEKYPWPARSPYGKINTASMLDINAWYVTNKLSAAKFPPDRLVNASFVEEADKTLGPFQLENKDSKLPGCRE